MATSFQASGVVEWHWVTGETGIVDPLAPTATAINAGVRLTCDIRETEGFGREQSFIDDPSGCSKDVGKIVGQRTLMDSSMTFKLYDGGVAASNPLKATLAEGTKGWLVHAYSGVNGTDGDVDADDIVNLYKVQVGAHSVATPFDNNPSSWVASFGTFAVYDDEAVV